jgi:hypothetical protein
MPNTATRSPARTRAALIAAKVVTPSQVSGAASRTDTASGTGTT